MRKRSKKKAWAAASLGLAATALVAGCGTAISSGTVTGKQDVPAHETTIWLPHYRTVCGYRLAYSYYRKAYVSQYSCRTVYAYSLPMPRYVPEEWRLHVHNSSQDGWVDVSQSTYDSQAINSHWQAVQGS
jgi:hypothetical protein